mmetsp:Transcript_58090/g.118081  ORF Transcript_58090/g.118081 Transcript_58090/m.118081 type:complete len:94 (+) Transcript_58090:1-282(+)
MRSGDDAPQGEAAPVVAMGFCSAAIEGVGLEEIWRAMLLKTGEGIVDFLPVEDVRIEDRGAYIWRSMLFVGPGPLSGKAHGLLDGSHGAGQGR